MTADRAALVRLTWTLAAAEPARFAAHFHARLLALEPSLGLLLVGADPGARARALVEVLDVATRHLHRFAPAARDPRPHPADSAVGRALLHALERTLGPERWTAAARDARAEALAAILGALRAPAPAAPAAA